MRQLIFLFCVAAATIFTAGCRKNIDITEIRETGTIPTENVETYLTGSVTDENGLPVENATVLVDYNIVGNTNEDGLFKAGKAILNKNGTLITVLKEGYFNASRFVFSRLGGKSSVTIQLIPKKLTSSFSSNSGSSFEISDGTKVTIPANSIVTESNGAPYTGIVNAYAVFLSPDDDDNYRTMPGDMRAKDEEMHAKILNSFGIVGVELESSTGEPLALAPNSSAQISIALSATLTRVAPDELPMWHFDKYEGYWVEEGKAIKVNDRLEATVTHFSFWNCSRPSDYVFVSGRVLDRAGSPLSGVYLTAKADSRIFGQTGGFTDDEGYYRGIMPAETDILLEIPHGCAGAILHSSEIGPFNNDAVLPDINITLENQVNIRGKLTDCTGNPLSNGVAVIRFGTNYSTVYSNSDGVFDARINNCHHENIVITGYQMSSLFTSEKMEIPDGNSDVDAGTIQVCSDVDEYAVINMNGKTYNFHKVNILTSDQTSGILKCAGFGVMQDTLGERLHFEFKDYQQSTGEGIVSYLKIQPVSLFKELQYECLYGTAPNCNCSTTEAGKLIFTQYPTNAGEYAIGTCTGIIKNENGDNSPFTMSFRIKKD